MHKTKCTNQQADNYIIKTNLPSQDVILSIGLSDITMIAVYVKNRSSFLNFVYVALCFSRTCLGMADLRTCISCVFITSQSICIIPTWSSLGIMDSGNTMGYYQLWEHIRYSRAGTIPLVLSPWQWVLHAGRVDFF